MTDQSQTCVNCHQPVTSRFCSECGQSAKVLPITWKGLITELSSRWIGMDNRFARTFINLWLRPAQVISEYLAGNRVKYIGPLSYLLVMSALYILSFSVFGVTTEEFLGKAVSTFDTQVSSESQQTFKNEYVKMFSDNMRLMVASMIPFMALSMMLFYRNRNYLEYFLVACYATSQLLWLSILMLAIFSITNQSLMSVGFITNILYFIWVIGSLNKGKSKVRTYGKALVTWIVGYVFFVVAISIIAIALVFTILSAS